MDVIGKVYRHYERTLKFVHKLIDYLNKREPKDASRSILYNMKHLFRAMTKS